MNCTRLPLNKIYTRSSSSTPPLAPSIPPSLSRPLAQFPSPSPPAPEIEEVGGRGCAARATDGCRYYEIVEELSGCINLITQYGGSCATGVNTIILHKTARRTKHNAEAQRPAGRLCLPHTTTTTTSLIMSQREVKIGRCRAGPSHPRKEKRAFSRKSSVVLSVGDIGPRRRQRSLITRNSECFPACQ